MNYGRENLPPLGLREEDYLDKLLWVINDSHDDYYYKRPQLDKLPEDGMVDLYDEGDALIKLNYKTLVYICYYKGRLLAIYKIKDMEELLYDLMACGKDKFLQDLIYRIV